MKDLDQTKFKILPEFQELLRKENEEEYELLEASILAEGCRDSLVVWKEENVLVDGHHRLEICERHGIPFTVIYRSFRNVEAVKTWMEENQLARRNLDKQDRDRLIQKRRAEGKTQREIAKEFGISKMRVSQIERESKETLLPTQHSPSLNKDELIDLKLQLENGQKEVSTLKNENERLRKEQLSEIDAKVKARTDVMKEEYQRRFDEAVAKVKASNKPAEVDRKLIDELVEKRAAEMAAELDTERQKAVEAREHYDQERAALQKQREADKKKLQTQLDEKTQELSEAAKKHLDLKKLQAEYDALEKKKFDLAAEVQAEAIIEKIRKALQMNFEAFSSGLAALEITSNEILTRDDYAGLSLEELEKYELNSAKLYAVAKKLVEAFHCAIEKIKKGGALRVV